MNSEEQWTEPSDNTCSAASESPRTLSSAAKYLFSNQSPFVLAVATIVAWVARFSVKGWSVFDVLITVVVIAIWPLLEWVIHLYLLHSRPLPFMSFQLDFMHARKHRAHHQYPWKLDTLFIPLRTYLFVIPLLVVVGYLGFAYQVFVSTGVAIFLTLSLHYEWCHLLAHSKYTPRSRVYKRIWRNHRLHHFKNENLWLGVSTTLGDKMLGTSPASESVPRSDTCRTLGVSDTDVSA